MLNIKIAAISHYQPEKKISSADIDERLGLTCGSTEKKSGLKYRYFASNAETSSTMGAIAAKRALEKIDLAPSDVDVIISAAGVGEQAIPCTAALIQQQLGLESSGIPCFDINATCLSFLVALETAAYFILAGRFNRILIVASDLPSRGLNWNDLETCSIFGDGAAAVVIEACQTQSAILATHLETHSKGADICYLKAGGTKIPASDIAQYQQFGTFHMEGKKVFKMACKLIDNTTKIVLDKANVALSDLDWVIPHQGSQLAINHVKKRLKIPCEKYADLYKNLANQMSASIPSAMSLLVEQGKLRRGQLLYLLGSGAGLAAGGLIMVY
jgi:3-oxoacyl-[acyl-carrier-protein] synthase III